MKTLDDETRKVYEQDLRIYEILSLGVKTEFGKELIKLLDDSIVGTEKAWMKQGLNDISDEEISLYRRAVRSKLQTLKGLKIKLEEAELERQRLVIELKE